MRSLLPALLIVLALAAGTGTAGAYVFRLDAPEELQAGAPLLVSGNSTLPPGTQFDIVLYSLIYNTPEQVGERVIVADESKSFETSFATNGLQAGPYKVEVRFYDKTLKNRLGSGSVTVRQVNLVDRSSEIFLTIPREQTMDWALLIEGYLPGSGPVTIRLKVNGPDGFSIPDQTIRTTTDLGRTDGHFSKKVNVTMPGNYFVDFYDPDGFVAQIVYTVNSSGTIPGTEPTTTPAVPPVTIAPSETATVSSPVTVPSLTRSTPFPLAAVIAGLVLAGIFAAGKRRN